MDNTDLIQKLLETPHAPYPLRHEAATALEAAAKRIAELEAENFMLKVRPSIAEVLARAEKAEADLAAARKALPYDIRAGGWSVAVHNDYRLNGEFHTFWLFTKGGFCVKGEGTSDRAALDEVRAAIAAARASLKSLP